MPTTHERGESSRQQTFLRVRESIMGQIIQRLGETSMGRNVEWAKRLETYNSRNWLFVEIYVYNHSKLAGSYANYKIVVSENPSTTLDRTVTTRQLYAI